ncbi:hypothetical protein ACFXAW_25670 [Streptomyces sp. NPDC059445]|uniref:hypothetical protein n=1 Tax=Streptomyces sp. NPDC059445 TaxID=3346832 RepID=UPI0036A235E7
MNALVETLIRAARSGLGGNLEEINEAMLDLGWASAGAIAPPYSRHWEAKGIRFNVFEDAGGWCADVLFRELWPEDEEDLGSDAVAKACEVEGKFR